MDTEMFLNQMEQDFEELAKEHEGTADNETIWAEGSSYPHIEQMHRENAEQHRHIARMYRRMKKNCLAFIETYEDDSNYLED